MKAWVHISLADLMRLDGSSALQEEWTAQVRAAWAGHRAATGGSNRGDVGAWLDGEDADAIVCDAAMAPFVIGEVNPEALEDLVRLCVQLDGLGHRTRDGGTGAGAGTDDVPGGHSPDADAESSQATPAPGTTLAWEAIEQAIIGKAIIVLRYS